MNDPTEGKSDTRIWLDARGDLRIVLLALYRSELYPEAKINSGAVYQIRN